MPYWSFLYPPSAGSKSLPLEDPRPALVTLLFERTVPSPEETTETPALLRSAEELRETVELLPLWAALLEELPDRTALELEEPLRVLVLLLRVELLPLWLLELPLRTLLEELLEVPLLRVLPLWLLRVALVLPLWLEELPLLTLLELLEELLPLFREVLPLWLEELPLRTLLELLEELLPLLRELLPLLRVLLPLLRVELDALVPPFWLLRVEDDEVLPDCLLLLLLLRVALLVEVLPEERVEDEEDVVVERRLLPELRLCAIASTLSRSMRATAPAAES